MDREEVEEGTCGACAGRCPRGSFRREDLWEEYQARSLFLERAEHQGLSLRLVRVEYSSEAKKVTFYFCSEGRVDFRQLVRDLAQRLHRRVEMRQISTRRAAQILGGVGPCGRELCCTSWLKEFPCVSMDMAREQGLSPNPSRLEGLCGRLKCCLRYEYETYREMGKDLPALGAEVLSIRGRGTVVDRSVLKQTVTLRREEDGVEWEVSREELVEKKVPSS